MAHLASKRSSLERIKLNDAGNEIGTEPYKKAEPGSSSASPVDTSRVPAQAPPIEDEDD